MKTQIRVHRNGGKKTPSPQVGKNHTPNAVITDRLTDDESATRGAKLNRLTSAIIANTAFLELLVDSMNMRNLEGNWTQDHGDKIIAGIGSLSDLVNQNLEDSAKALWAMRGDI